MTSYDFFEITGLPFDPPEKMLQKVRAAIEKAENDIGGELGSVTQTQQRDELNEKRAFLTKLKTDLFTADGKLVSSELDRIAEIRKAAVKQRLAAAVKLTKSSKQELIVTNGTIRTQRQKTKLSKESVEEVYRENGFTIIQTNPLAAMPKFPINAERIYANLAQLRQEKDPNPNGKDLTKSVDLYAFAAYLEGTPESAEEYRNKETKNIAKIFDVYAKSNSMIGDRLGKLCVEIATAGKTNVFNSEANRLAYDQFLRYKSPELTELFSIMKDTTKSDRLDESFAEACIKKITEVFGDKNVALAIYNNEAELRDNPYISEKPSFSVKCGHCQNMNEFSSVTEAKERNKCKHCNEQLYRKCAHCGKLVLAFLDRCSECGFTFANIEMFSKYIGLAENALKHGNIGEARDLLLKAKTADPSEIVRTSVLDKKIDAEEKKYAEPLQKLRVLILNRRFSAAADYIGSIVAEYSDINILEQEKQTRSTMERCRRMFDEVRNRDKTIRINTSLDILDVCADFGPAIDFLRSTTPSICSGLSCTPDNSKGTMLLAWKNSNERGVKFRIVRKAGHSASENELDGEVIADDYSKLTYEDKNIIPGMYYTYSLFAKRMETFSSALSAGSVALVVISNIEYFQKGNRVLLSWETPRNCESVTVTKIVGGRKSLVSNAARNSAEDNQLEFNVPHSYYFVANYREIGKSEKVHVLVVPTVVIDAFSISVKKGKHNFYDVSWSISQNGVDIQIFVNGEKKKQTCSDVRRCTIELEENSFFHLQAKAFSEGTWIESQNTVDVNTYRPCEFEAEIEEKTFGTTGGITNKVELTFYIKGEIPSNISNIIYFVRTKDNISKPAPWASEEDVRNALDSCKVDVNAYRKNRKIVCSITAKKEETYYVTFFTVYEMTGKTVLSVPSYKKINRLLRADLFWKVKKSIWGAQKLQIEIKANKALIRLPAFILCVSASGKYLLSPNDSTALKILELPERTNDNPSDSYSETFEITKEISKNQKLFMFEVNRMAGEEFTFRWANGFEGKV